eukprot:jgi/Botrbrau1/13371/Bobra.0194s0004.1
MKLSAYKRLNRVIAATRLQPLPCRRSQTHQYCVCKVSFTLNPHNTEHSFTSLEHEQDVFHIYTTAKPVGDLAFLYLPIVTNSNGTHISRRRTVLHALSHKDPDLALMPIWSHKVILTWP